MTFALIDGNCFYCSCERVFRPSLKGKPLIVLSNNDGCAISRSDEAKAIGVKMGDPWFKIRHLENTRGLVAMSANFPLYGDMSDRMMTVIGRFSPRQEIYSIDESFIDLSGFQQDLAEYGQRIRAEVLRDTGIPTCVGIGSTKTLAKLANHIAKKQPQWKGVCDLTRLNRYELAALMQNIEAKEVWGIGRRVSRRLADMGVYNVLDLAKLDPDIARAIFSTVTSKTIQELRGISRLELEEMVVPKKQIIASRSFGVAMVGMAELQSALSQFIAMACHKLRAQDSIAGSMQIFITTSPFDQGRQYGNSRMVVLPCPTADNLIFTKYALKALDAIWRPGYKYKKAGVMLMEIVPSQPVQGELCFGDPGQEKRAQLMTTLDEINARFGRGTLKTGSIGFHDKEHWYMRQERKSPGYTTNWHEVPIARA